MGARQYSEIIRLRADLEAANDELKKLRGERDAADECKYKQFAQDLFTLYPPLWAAHADHYTRDDYNPLSERPNFSATAVLAQAMRDVKRLDKSTHAEVLRYIEAVATRASTNPTTED